VLTEKHLIFSTLIAAAICAVLILWTSKIARRISLVDRPTARKQHLGEIPIVGGFCIYLAALVALLSVPFSSTAVLPLLTGSGLVILGVIDDRSGLSTLFRFPAQVASALIMISIGSIGIESIGNIFGNGPVVMTGLVSIFFTVMCTVGVINSINMIDGIDGLSGAIVSVTLLVLVYFNYLAGDIASVALMLALLSATLVFLFFNARIFRARAMIFMGDAGSTLFGFLFVWSFIRLTQGDDAVLSPVAAGWIFGLPLIDTVSVMVRRIVNGKSPFEADRNHLHHRFLDVGLTPNRAVVCMTSVHIILMCGGLLCNLLPSFEHVFFWLFVLVVILHFFITPLVLVPNKNPRNGENGVPGNV